jgi:ubiquinone/menaquinone biosynthesis C-methylase UbiE
MTNTSFEEIKKQQKEVWNKFSHGWKRWDDLTMDFCRPVTNEMIHLLGLKDNDMVLDVAGGTGEPGLTIASIVKNGKVIAVDQSEGMLSVAREKVQMQGIKNYEIKVAEVSALPFPDNTFDAISCRFGFMFFPDMLLAAKEMARVVKPRRKIVIAVWDIPEKNFWVTAIMSVVMKNLHVTPPPPDAPGMFRCAQEGFMSDIFRKAGLNNIMEKEVPLKLNCKTAENYWNYMTEVGAAIVVALSKADDVMKEKIKREVIELINNKYTEDKIAIDACSRVIYGEKGY